MGEFSMAPVDITGTLAQGQGLVPNPLADDAQRAQLQAQQLQNAVVKQKLQAVQQQAVRQQQFQTAFQQSDGKPQSIARLMGAFPEFADTLKSIHDTTEPEARQNNLTALSEIYFPAQSGNYALAAKQARARFEADKAAGHAEPGEEDVVKALESGDPTQQKAATSLIGAHIYAADPAHFHDTFGMPGEDRKGQVVGRAIGHYDDQGKWVVDYRDPDAPQYREVQTTDANGNPVTQIVAVGGGGGGPVSGAGGGTSPAAASVASALASSGLPAPVVAGFMGNFHAEGGYDGAQGDGGSASGIGQWRGKRAANFERIIGKPVTQATPAEQAQFVSWEMQNPEAAGMTVKQRDAIMAAKTPAQAAALIDQYYERSSGRDRNIRMSAATAFAGDGTGQQPGGGKVVYSAASAPKPGQMPPPGNPDLTGPAYQADLQKTNPSLAAQVQGVLDTRLAYPPATARSPQAQQLRAAVLQVDPSYDEQAYKRRQTTIQQYTPGHAGPGQSMLSAATLINHMYELAQSARNLPDHATRAQNAVSSWWGGETNAPWLIKFNEGRKFISSELPKFLNGKAPTEGEQRDHMDSYSPSKGKSGIQTALSTDVDYLYGRYQPLLQAYKDNTGKDLNIDNYAPGQATRAKAAALEYYRANGALPVVVTSAAQAAKLPHGAVFATPDGRVLTRH